MPLSIVHKVLRDEVDNKLIISFMDRLGSNLFVFDDILHTYGKHVV